MKMKAIEIRWNSGDAKGYTDVFPIDEFGREVTGAERLHLVRGPHGGKYEARYRLKVKATRADLDYRPFAAFNRHHGMYVGVMQLQFNDRSRATVKSVFWDGQHLDEGDVSVGAAVLSEPPSPGEDAACAQQRLANVQIRDGQVEFRRSLDLVYGSRCCISGCGVARALEAAHIKPYAGKMSNTESNGLLLRRDLHALFDGHQLAIHPTSRFVHFSPETREYQEYAAMHKKVRLASPQAGYLGSAPDAAALNERWSAFTKTHGGGS
jgi:hypothetical protein